MSATMLRPRCSVKRARLSERIAAANEHKSKGREDILEILAVGTEIEPFWHADRPCGPCSHAPRANMSVRSILRLRYRIMSARSESASFLARPSSQGPGRKLFLAAVLTTRRVGFAAIAAVVDLSGFAVAAAAAYMLTPYDSSDVSNVVDRIGMLASTMATFFVTITVLKCHYGPALYLSYSAQVEKTTTAFSLAFLFTAAIGVATGATAEVLCARSVALLGLSLPAVLVGRFILVRRVKTSVERAGLTTRRIMLVGTEAEIDAFYRRFPPEEGGMRVVTAAVLRGQDTLTDDLTLAATMTRVLRADDVFILAPWSDTETVETCLEAFLCVPAAVHLGPGPMLDRLAQARIVKTGRIASLALDHSSLSGPNALLKRAVDIVMSSIALIILAPVFLAVAIAIKLDSRGPVLFQQRRYGFNQEPFRIFKFRSMRTLEDDRNVKQASEDDPRVTRIGRFIRRTNLDELPQLVNVLIGAMSLVGPRPHALAHDQLFGPSVNLYGRRHNVKPGITGWAQVNGLRGEVTPETLRARVEHDLYYVDNWSLWLDLWILWRTIASRKAFLNAY